MDSPVEMDGAPGLVVLLAVPVKEGRDVRAPVDGAAGGPIELLVPTEGRGLGATADGREAAVADGRVEEFAASCFVGDFVGDFVSSKLASTKPLGLIFHTYP